MTWRDIAWVVVSLAVFIFAAVQLHRFGRD